MNVILRRAGHSKHTVDGISSKTDGKVVPKKSTQKINASIVIRWGCTTPIECKNTINRADAISAASDKANSRRMFREGGVRIPDTYDGLGQEPEDKSGLWIHRPVRHFSGQDFTVLEWKKAIKLLQKSGGYLSRVIEKTKEYRVHVGHGKVLAIQEKPIKDGEILANRAVTGLDWRVLKWSEYTANLCKQAVLATESLGLDFGAVDIILGKDKKYYVLEVNTAPSVTSEIVSIKYARYFSWLVGGKRLHIDSSSMKKGRSFAMKIKDLT